MRKKKIWSRLVSGGLAFLTAAALWPAGNGDTVYAAGNTVTSETEKLTVNMGEQQGEILHGASGFLYGVSSEDVPTTNTLVPLNAKVLATKGALGTEHPYGDALDVAKTFLESGGEQVMMYNSNYYGVFGVMTDYEIYAKDLKETIAPAVSQWKEQWKEEHGTPEEPKDTIGARVDIDQAIIYVPVNEGTPNWGAKDFGVAWEAYYKAIKEADPEAVVAGTNDWYYNKAFGFHHDSEYEVKEIPESATEEEAAAIVEEINAAEKAARSKDVNGNEIEYNLDAFLPYCIEHDCMPDIITWHELDEDALIKMADHKADFTAKWEKYWGEAIEKGLTDRKKVPRVPQIIINEYATGYDCGIPGRLVNWIARFEDNEMYGCLPFWHQANDLNDLAAEANEGNGAWWAFKWYGDMSGQRLKVSSTAYYDQLYGLAAIDEQKESAKVLFGGQDGAASVILENLDETKVFQEESYVHIKVEAASYVGMEGSEYGPPVLLEGDFAVDEDGDVSVSIQNMKFSTAYCMTVTKTDAEQETSVLTSSYINYYEAEEAQISGNASVISVYDNKSDYFGPTKYMSNDGGVYMKKGGKLTYSIQVPVDGRYKLTYVYGNGTGTLRNQAESSVGLNQTQTMETDGTISTTMVMKNTLLTNNMGNHVEYLDLAAGTHTISITSTDETENGEVLHDVLVVSYEGAYNGGSVSFDKIYEAEEADFNTLTSNKTWETNKISAVKRQNKLEGYSGSGYVTGLSEISVEDGGGIRWTVVVEESGLYNMEFRYQSQKEGKANLYIGNTDVTLTNLAKTIAVSDTKEKWKTSGATVYLQKGINIIDFDATADIALDYMRVKQPTEEETADLVTIIEAEDCIPSGAEGSYEIRESTGASGGKYVAGMNGSQNAKDTPGQYLEFTYEAEEEGSYQLQIFQSNDEICGSHSYNTKIIDKYMSVAVTDQEGEETSNHRYFFINTYSQDTFKEKSISLYLTKGTNKIRVYNDDSWKVYYGGSQSVAGTNVLVNRTPNLDKFIITPLSLEQALEQKEEYRIDIRTTEGGYAASAQNYVEKGGTFDVLITPEEGIRQILVNGEEKTEEAKEQKDGTYTLAIKNVKKDVTVQIYFQNPNEEATDEYIINPGFGTGDTYGWTAEGVEVNKRAQNSYDGYHAELTKDSSLVQTVEGIPAGNYYLGLYSRGSQNVSGKVKMKVVVSSKGQEVNSYEKEICLGENYEESVLALWIGQGMTVEISADTSELKKGAVFLDNFSIKAAESRDTASVDSSVLYFVDCGDNNVSTLPKDEMFGTRNSKTDSYYGVDPNTGYKWGIVITDQDYPVDAQNLSVGLWTKWQAARSWESNDLEDKYETWRCTDFQNQENGYTGSEKYIRYAFELEPGEYTVETGYYNMWGSCYGGNVTVKANGEEAETFDMGEATNYTDIAVSRSVNVTVGEDDGNKLSLSYERALDGGTLYVSYIKITRAGENPEADLSVLKQLYNGAASLSNEEGAYEESSWAALQQAMEAAKVYIEADFVGLEKQEEVNQCAEALRKAMAQLRTAESMTDSSLLYFVDCGDNNPATISGDGKLGSCQSLTDQVFAKDSVTGMEWGLVDKNGTNDSYVQGGKVFTNWIDAQPVADGSSVEDSFVFAANQFQNLEQIGGSIYISYKFQTNLEDGVYPVSVGFGNSWGCCDNPAIYTDYGTENQKQLSQDGFTVTKWGKGVWEGEAAAVNGYLTLDILMDPEAGNNESIQLTYIEVKKPVKEEASLVDLEIKAPDKTEYLVGEELDTAGMSVKALYSDDSQRELTDQEYTIRGFYTTTEGTRGAVISYKEGIRIVTKTFLYKVTEPEQLPVQKDALYQEIEKASQILASINPEEYTADSIEALKAALTEANALYGNEEATQEQVDQAVALLQSVGLIERSPEELVISSVPNKVSYVTGEELDTTGLEVILKYNNGTWKTLSDQEYQISGFDSSIPCENLELLVTAVGYPDEEGVALSASLWVQVIEETGEPYIHKLQVTPDRTEYGLGETLDISGWTVEAVYTDGTRETLSPDSYTFNGNEIDMNISGEKTVVITYENQETGAWATGEARIVVDEEPVLADLRLTSPEKLTYQKGEELDLTGLLVTGIYTDQTERQLTEDEYQVGGYNKDTVGVQTIYVSSGSIEKTFQVTVEEIPIQLVGLEINGKTLYQVGEQITPDKLTVTAVYSDGSRKVLSSEEYQINGFDSFKPGEITVTILFGEMTEELRVTIQEKPGADPDDTESPGETPDNPDDTENPGETPDNPNDTENPGETPDSPNDTENPGETPDNPDDTNNSGDTNPDDTEGKGKNEPQNTGGGQKNTGTSGKTGSSGQSSEKSAVKTGDTTWILPWTAAGLCSAAIWIRLSLRGKKKNNK